MEPWHQRNPINETFPFHVIITDITEFPPHWHEELEIVYALDYELMIGLNHEVYILKPRDIFLIGPGEVHFFVTPPQKSQRIILQFEPSLFESFVPVMRERRFTFPLIAREPGPAGPGHRGLEQQILNIAKEHSAKQEGYQLAIKARLYDMIVVLLRHVPMEPYSSFEQHKHLKRLERLEQVFRYVETHHTREIPLEEIARAANFSIYHFTRFFKEATGMTFVQYLNNYRITKAAKLLANTSDPVTEIAFKVGFESIKTFNRVFKQIKGCNPTTYKKSMVGK